MERLIINSSMDWEMVETINNFLKESEESSQKVIYFSSGGGKTSIISPLKSILETTPNTNIVFCNEISSSALILMLTVKCSKTLLEESVGCFHLPYFEGVDVNHDLSPRTTYPVDMLKSLGTYTKEALNIVSKYISKSEVKDIKSSKDVWLTTKRLKKILKNDDYYLHSKEFFRIFAE